MDVLFGMFFQISDWDFIGIFHWDLRFIWDLFGISLGFFTGI